MQPYGDKNSYYPTNPPPQAPNSNPAFPYTPYSFFPGPFAPGPQLNSYLPYPHPSNANTRNIPENFGYTPASQQSISENFGFTPPILQSPPRHLPNRPSTTKSPKTSKSQASPPQPPHSSFASYAQAPPRSSFASFAQAHSCSSKPVQREGSPPCPEQLADRLRLETKRFKTMSSNDYGDVLRDISSFTVDKLKNALRRINEHFALHHKYSGLKAELYARLRAEVDRIYTYDRANFPAVKTMMSQVARPYAASTSSAGSGYGSGGYNLPAATTAAYGASNYNSGYGASSSNYGTALRTVGTAPAGTSAAGGASRFGAGGTGAYGAASSALGGGAAGAAINRWQNDDVPIKFRPSPFYRVEKSLSPPVTLFKADVGDRKVGSMSFGLTEAQRNLINDARASPNNPQYEVRLYCTSDNNYSIGRPHASQFPAPIEFPQACEIKLNNVTVNVNTKGIKKQPGTTPPVNLSSKKGPTVVTGAGQLNKVELIYANTERTTYYMVAYLVETTPIKKVVEKVKAGRTKSKEEVIQSIKDINSDEEIAAGPLGLSLRDPLSFARIGTPVRSKMCNHISCFDAETWFEMNEQTPTWNCPICSKTLKFEEMVVDGYFEDILKICPGSVDAVMVNPDGTWRSDDNKYGTGPPRPEKTATNDSTRNSPDRDREESTKPDISGNENGNGNGKGKSKQPEALTLDSDSDGDDQPLAKRPRIGGFGGNGGVGGSSASGSPFTAGGGSGATNGWRGGGRGASEVLDLTLTDSEDDAPAPPARPAPIRPPIGLNGAARTSSGGPQGGVGGVKTVADVQRDIDAMQQRMRDEYGDDWRTRFSV